MTKLIYRWLESIKCCRKRRGKVLHYRHEVADAHNVIQHSWWVVLLHGSNVERAGGSCNSNWCGQECWCKEGWRDLKWFMVSAWISLNVEPKTYRTGEDTATSQLREQGGKSPPCRSVVVLYNAITEDLITGISTVDVYFGFSDLFSQMHYIHSFLLHPNLPLPPASSFISSVSGRAHRELVDALVDGDGHHSAWDSGLCLSRLPPLSHHHLLQGHQEVGCHFFSVLFLLLNHSK